MTPLVRRPSFVPSLKLTEAEREMLGPGKLPAIDGLGAAAADPRVASARSGASKVNGSATAGADESKSQVLPGTADDGDDGGAAQPAAPVSSSSVSPTSESLAPAVAFSFEPFRGRWHYGQPVLARYRKTPHFFSGNIATYLGAGLFMVVFDDGTLDYRVKREDLMIVSSEGSDGPVAASAVDASASLAPPNTQLMVDFSVSPPRQQLLSLDGGFDDKLEEAKDEFLAKYRRLYADEPDESIVRPLARTSGDTASQSTLPVTGPSIPDESIYLKQLENGVAFEEDSTQVSDSDDSDDSNDVDDGGELMTPWQQMTQTFGMAKTLRPRAARRSSLSSVSQVERMSTRLTKQVSMTNVLSPKSFKQIISDYLSKHSKKVRPSAQHSTESCGPPAELTQIEWLECMTRSLDAAQIERPVAASSESSPQAQASAPSGRAAPVPVTLPSTTPGLPQRVVYERRADGARAYGTVKARLASGDVAVITEDEQMITVQAFCRSTLIFLPSTRELVRQARCLAHDTKELFAGRRVQVLLYPGSRFSGNGLIVLEKRDVGDAKPPSFHVLLQNRTRLLNVPGDMLVPLREKTRGSARAHITDDQFLICSNKTKVFIGDQVFVKCAGEMDGATTEEKVGVLNGVYSNRTAAIDFADGSTGYEVLPHRISKRKKPRYPQADQDVLSLKNAVLMQARSSGGGGGNGSGSGADSGSRGKDGSSTKDAHAASGATEERVDYYTALYDIIEEGFQVLADHPRRATVERCVVIKTHTSSACDLRFADGTIAFEVFPSQMVLEGGGRVERRRKCRRRRSRSQLKRRGSRLGRTVREEGQEGDEYEEEDEEEYEDEWEPSVGDYVLAWSSRFGRYCSAKVSARTALAVASTPGSPPAPAGSVLFSVVFDYGEQRANMPVERLARLDDPDALSPTQKLTNYSIDTMGFELWPVSFSVGEAVMARVHGSSLYFPGVVECGYDSGNSSGSTAATSASGSGSAGRARRNSNRNVSATAVGPRVCGVLFDSGERDTHVPFSSAFSIDARTRYTHNGGGHGAAAKGGGSSSSGKGAHPASAGPVSSGVNIALGLGLGAGGLLSNDPLVYQIDAESGAMTPAGTNLALNAGLSTHPVDGSAAMMSTSKRRRSSGGSVSSMLVSMAGSLFGWHWDRDDGQDVVAKDEHRRSSQLLTEIGAKLKRRASKQQGDT